MWVLGLESFASFVVALQKNGALAPFPSPRKGPLGKGVPKCIPFLRSHADSRAVPQWSLLGSTAWRAAWGGACVRMTRVGCTSHGAVTVGLPPPLPLSGSVFCGPTLEWWPCIPGSSAQGSGMGRLSTSWRGSKHAFRPGPCPKFSPSAWRSVQPMATLHPGCADWRLPSARRRIWHWSPGLWRPSIGTLPSREEAPARRRTCRLEPLCTSGMRPPRRTIRWSRRWRPYRGRCGSGLGRPPPSGVVTLTARRASGSTAPRWESPGGSVDRPQQDPG